MIVDYKGRYTEGSLHTLGQLCMEDPSNIRLHVVGHAGSFMQSTNVLGCHQKGCKSSNGLPIG